MGRTEYKDNEFRRHDHQHTLQMKLNFANMVVQHHIHQHITVSINVRNESVFDDDNLHIFIRQDIIHPFHQAVQITKDDGGASDVSHGSKIIVVFFIGFFPHSQQSF